MLGETLKVSQPCKKSFLGFIDSKSSLTFLYLSVTEKSGVKPVIKPPIPYVLDIYNFEEVALVCYLDIVYNRTR